MFVIIRPADERSTRTRYMAKWSRPSNVAWTYDAQNRMQFDSLDAARIASAWILTDIVYIVVPE